ncbi:MAG: hypothetical protein V4820_15770 [Pseudomonadota bacterium]|uniref:hypothetical protein n=1 Tax=Phenylobacterium sp. TaxID=1871053 RepID=UPI00272565F7|nr:hypothetical protein [Phenylobacterium sp.]MDO9430543.1 hypothetical protein [Phenylobacterium sp.]
MGTQGFAVASHPVEQLALVLALDGLVQHERQRLATSFVNLGGQRGRPCSAPSPTRFSTVTFFWLPELGRFIA